MLRIREWIHANKLASLLLLIIAVFFLKNYFMHSPYIPRPMLMMNEQNDSYTMPNQMQGIGMGGGIAMKSAPMMAGADIAPQSRMVVSNSSVSLMVKDVVSSQKAIIGKAEELGGFMVDSNLSNPQDQASAMVTVRVPSTKMNEVLEYFRGLAVKVVSENLRGEDVTQEYVDNDARLATLTATKQKFEEILSKATAIQDILNVQRELINLQDQIDGIKGQQQYLDRNASMAKITVYLSTDELALPYAPDNAWRPTVIFKEAVRSLIGAFQKVGTFVIWAAIYSVIWIPILLIFVYIKRRNTQKMN